MKPNRIGIFSMITGLVVSAAQAEGSLPLVGTSVTVLPISLQVQERPADNDISIRITEVLGLMLENAGMTDVRIAESGWADEGTDDELAERLATHIRTAPLPTDSVMWVRFSGAQALERIDWVLCGASGEILSRDTSIFTDASPADPMHACLFVARALQNRSDLNDPTSRSPVEGRMARLMRERAGLPSPTEIEGAKTRLGELNGTWTNACAVFPVRVVGPDQADDPLASTLAERLRAAGLGQPVATQTKLTLDVPGDPNQMKVLWDTARAFRAYLRLHPTEEPYALLVELGPIPGVRYVHVILCSQDGDWVVVDMQNNHHEDFQQVAPTSAEKCLDLAVLRLQRRIQNQPETP